jgi:hypothetical protein
VPTLRFSRDRRGYESTYLVHTSKRRPGAEQSQLLYWFRTPPHVKIGRAAFDEDAIRMLEEQHPDVEFEWDRILTTKAPAVPEPRDPRDARPPRRPERRPVRESRRDPPRAPLPGVPALAGVVPIEPEVIDAATAPPPAAAFGVSPPAVDTPAASLELSPPVAPVASAESPARRFVRVFDAPADVRVFDALADAPIAPAHRATEPSVCERLLGAEHLTVLRARHAEILARISARGGDPARLEALREQATSVDPDTWVTESEVTAGLAAVDATLAELHRIVGRRRRRRGRRRDSGPRPGMAPEAAGGEGTAGPADEVGDHDEAESDPAEDGPADE